MEVDGAKWVSPVKHSYHKRILKRAEITFLSRIFFFSFVPFLPLADFALDLIYSYSQ